MTVVLLRGKSDTKMHRECDVTAEAEIGVTHLPGKEHKELSATMDS